MVMAWGNVVKPFLHHQEKPRQSGLTMVMDKGQGMSATKDLLEVSGKYIDFLKLGFGTSVFYSAEVLQQKIQLCKTAGVEVYPGGTLLEAAIVSGNFVGFISRAKELGFAVVELSDGTVTLPKPERLGYILQLKEVGFQVITEVGKKDAKDQLPIQEMRQAILDDLAVGTDLVIVEARESGKGIGIFDKDGNIKNDDLKSLVEGIDLGKVMFEAPHKTQQFELIKAFGSNVNLGNIPLEETLALETLRTGLRGDTLKQYLLDQTKN